MSRLLLLLLFCCVSLYIQAQVKLETELLVVGGSTGGTAAGITAARKGVKTVIIEATPWLGGMLTSAGVSCTDGNDELPSGIWQEFREALYKHYRTRDLFTGWVSETCFEPHVGDSIFKAWAAREKNLTVVYGWYFEKVIRNGDKVTGASFINKKGEHLTVAATLTIDGTDLGDVFASAGAPYDLGMEDKNYSCESMAPGNYLVIQDLTWVAVLQDYGKGTDKTISRPVNYDSTLYFCSCTSAPCLTGNPYKVDALKMLEYAKLPGGKYMINWPAHGNDYIANVVDIAPVDRDKALERARQKTLGFVYFIQTSLGFKNIGLSNEFASKDRLAYMPYHREGRRLKGMVRLTANDLTHPFEQANALYRTGISVGDYPVDHHHAPEKNAPSIAFPRVPSFNIPLGTLIPPTVKGLIVCEKGISVSNIVNGSSRLQPCVLLTGQAAGILAAWCIQKKLLPQQISVRAIQNELLNEKAFIMPYCDVKTTDTAWKAIQKIGATGIINGFGKPEGWANKTFFYPDSTIRVTDLENGFHSFYPGFPKRQEMNVRPVTLMDLMELVSRTAVRIDSENLNSSDKEKILTRREIAFWLDKWLQPFSRAIDLNGKLLEN